MAVERRAVPGDDPYNLIDDNDIEVQVDEPKPDATVQEHEDGSVTVDFSGPADEDKGDLPEDHDANLAEHLSKDELAELKDELVALVEADLAARKEWEDTYKDGLELLGIKVEERTKPWAGACGVYHPLITEALVRYESQAIMELFPPQGPAKTRIMGAETPEKLARARRKQDELNFILTERMPNYRNETEGLLWNQGLAGSAFRKVYYDPVLKRPEAKFVPADDLIIPYGESDARTSPRLTHRQFLTKNQIIRLQKAGVYRKVDLQDGDAQITQVAEAEAELDGVKPSQPTDSFEIYECHCEWDLGEDEDGLALPYIITVDNTSGEVLSVYRNWKEGDESYARVETFIQYKYLPGTGVYGFGLIHLIGGLTRSATSILRQLVDAGTLSNLPGGLKSRGLRIKGDDTPIRPGEFRDVDVPGQSIRDNITFLPYKEPSEVLYQLLGNLVEEGRRIGSIADMQVGDMNAEAPVGTTLALMERALKVMSAIQARNHASIQQELRRIGDIVHEEMPPQYEYEQDGNFNRQEDFASQDDIIPVSDPGATTMAQRVIQMQALTQMASQAPQVYDIAKLHRTAAETIGCKNADEIVPLPDEQKPRDPITENMAILKMEPVKAFLHQDHQAHIAVHMAAMQDPKLQQMVGQSPNAQTIQSAMMAHIGEHVAYAYRQQMEQQMGAALPAPDQPVPPEVEAQIARAAVPAAQALFKQNSDEAARQQTEQVMQDPLVQLQTRELALKEAELVRKKETDFAKLALNAEQGQAKNLLELLRIQTQSEADGTRMGIDISKHQDSLEQRAQEAAERIGQQAKSSEQARKRIPE